MKSAARAPLGHEVKIDMYFCYFEGRIFTESERVIDIRRSFLASLASAIVAVTKLMFADMNLDAQNIADNLIQTKIPLPN